RRIRPGPWLPSSRPLLGGGQDARLTEEPSDGVGRLGALVEPRLCPIGIDDELGRFSARVVVPERLERSPVTGASAVGDDDAIAGLLVRADARQPDTDCHECGTPPSGRDAGGGPYWTVM